MSRYPSESDLLDSSVPSPDGCPRGWPAPALAGMLFIFLPFCGGGGGGGTTPAPEPLCCDIDRSDILYHHDGSGIRDSSRLVVRQQGEFEELWNQATAPASDPPELPTVDFERFMVLAVAAGTSSPGDQIYVDSAGVREEGTPDGRREVLKVYVRTVHTCGDFQADTYPLQIVRVQRFDGPVEFFEESEAGSGCSRNPPPIEAGEPASP